MIDFIVVPSPLVLAVEQKIATFNCQHHTADAIGWKVNGTGPALDVINIPNITIDRLLLHGNDFLYTLIIGTLLEYNQTIIECVAIFFDGREQQSTAPVTLLSQGLST